ncbi:MAG: hypothetical protein MUC57_17290 [Desulfobacterales bacterium]|jgi:hypothetical protein|nr:hypothetical protein [Desulfobacterales bacterium]
MNPISPITATAIFGGAAALLSAGAISLPLHFVAWPARLNATLFLCVAAYAILLARLSARPIRSLSAPLLLLSAVLFSAASVTGFIVPAAAGLTWIRSGICFPGPGVRRAAAEILTMSAGLVLTFLLRPPGIAGLALGVWLFFLIQALYFAFVGPVQALSGELPDRDPRQSLHSRSQALLREQKLERAFSELQLSSQRHSDTY